MRMVRSGSRFFLVLLACCFYSAAQDSPIPAQSPAATSAATPLPEGQARVETTPAQSDPAPPAATLNDVMERVVQREHYFLAQMRHLHPLVETYLQDLKNDPDGNTYPIKDHYFLGRLDMSEGPEDVSFMGQPGFGRRMMTKLIGFNSQHYLPLGFAQMTVIDFDFQKKYYTFN